MMNQSTSFAQVATNLLNVLQGYSKTIRLLLIMFLTLTVSAEVLGALSSPYTCTFTTNLTLSNNQVKTGDVTWTLSTTIGNGDPATDFGNTNGQSAIKLGSGKKNYYSKMTLTTSAFSTYNVSKVVLYISSNNGGSKTITVKQGNTQIGTGIQYFTNSDWVTNCTRNTAKGSGGDLSIEISSDATATFIHSITVTYETAVATKYTVTLNAGPGTCAASVTETSAGAGVTLPTPTLDCGDWEFAGWKTTSAVTTETTTEPTLIPAGAYSPTSDITLYAVYQRTETPQGGGSSEETVDFSSQGYSDQQSISSYTGTDFSVAFNKGTNSNVPKYYTSGTAIRIYGGGYFTVSSTATITKIVLGFGGSDGSNAITTDVNTYANGTWTGSANSVEFTIGGSSGHRRIKSLAVTTTGGGSTTYYHSTPDCGDPCEKLGAATNLTVVTDFVQDGQTYVKFSWTPADNTKANATNQKLCFGKVDEAGKCKDNLAKNQTWAGDLKSKLEPGEYWWSIQALGDGLNYCDGDVVNGTNFTIEAPKASITLSELGITSTIDTYSVGDQYTLPTASSQSCEGKQLVGWSTEEVAETDTKPTENYYELGAEVTLEATQTFYAVFAEVNNEENLISGGDMYTKLPDWTYTGTETYSSNGIKFNDVNDNILSPDLISYGMSNLKIKLRAGYNGNKGSVLTFYAYKKDLTMFQDDEITITPASITPADTYTSQNTLYEIRLSANAPISKIAVWMTTDVNNLGMEYCGIFTTSSYSGYTTTCVPVYTITYDLDGGTGSHCTNTSVPQSDPTYTICDETPTKEGYNFLYWSDGTNTYAPSDEITLTSNITLTAQWQINTYTVIWSNNGAETEVPYNHGETLVIPEDPASCDGVKHFVGWTTHSGYYHATTAPDDIFTEKTATVTANASYYAVFATPGAGGTEFALGTSGTFKMYANVDGTKYYAQGGVYDSKLSSTDDILTASDYTLTHKGSNEYSIQFGNTNISHNTTNTNITASSLNTWTISTGINGSWRVTSTKDNSRALSYSTSASAFKAYATSNITAGDDTYFDIEFGAGSSGYSDYTTICEQVESIVVENPQTEFYVTDEFTIGTEGKVIATLSGGGTADVTALAHFSGYNMNVVGTYTITVTYMGATATYEINVKALDNAWALTWNVSGKTNTGLGPRSVTKGNAIGTLPVPEVPAACEGKTFMGWTESNTVPSDGVGIIYITEATVPTDNTTYYAVFANINNFCTQAAIEDIPNGSKVVVVAVASMDETGSSGKAISSRTISITSQGVIGLSGDDVSIFDEMINTPHSTCIWTLTKENSGVVLEQGGKYIRAVDGGYRKLLLENTKDYWTLTEVEDKYKTYHMESGNTGHFIEWFDHTDDKYDEGEKYIGFVPYITANNYGDFDMQFFITAGNNADITDYTTGCEEFTITYYGFRGGYSTSCSSDGVIVLPVNSEHIVPNCGDVVKDHTDLGREFLNAWMTEPHGGHTFKPGDRFILTQDTILYAQWKLETEKETTTLPIDIEDLAGTDVYVYGGTTLSFQPGTTTINSLALRGGIQKDGSYQMPRVWVPAGATLKRNSNKIYLDLAINAKNYYPFAVPFATKNDQYIDYLDPVLNAASTYDKHFIIKTYDGARRATEGEDRENNWVKVLRHQSAENPSYLQPGVGYIITALTYPDKDTATIRIPMTVPDTWFDNGEQTVVGTTTRNAVTVTGHTGAAATEHPRHAGWNFVASPYLSNFAGSGIGGGQQYIDGWINIPDNFNYEDTEVPYVTIPVADFAYYDQRKMSEVTLSPEWSFFVQIAADKGGTMNFAIDGRKQAPAALRANDADANPSFEANIAIVNDQEQIADHTGLVINDRYTTAYEIGGDLEKMFGSAYNTSVYTLSHGTRLAYNALSFNDAIQPIPLGYRAETEGAYTIQLTNSDEISDVESIVLKDQYNNVTTNLLLGGYTFYCERTQDDNRFVIYIVPRQNDSTDLPNIFDNTSSPHKIFHNGRLYIIHNGRIYNGNGQIVK